MSETAGGTSAAPQPAAPQPAAPQPAAPRPAAPRPIVSAVAVGATERRNTETPFDRKALSSTATVFSGTFWNLIGRAGPMAVAIAVTPSLIHLLGVERWGVLSTALAMVGMFGVFDFGIGRALTRMLAELIGLGEDEEAASLVKTGLAVLSGVGVLVGLAAFGLVFGWSHWLMKVAAGMRGEVMHALYVLCLALPLVIFGGALFGVISAFQRFRITNIVTIPVISFYYLGPLIAAYFTHNLIWVMASLVMVRAVLVLIYGTICLRTMPSLRTAIFDAGKVGGLVRMGGWMTVSNVTFPILQYCDRLVLISVLSASAVGYYSTPADMVSRFFIIVGAVMASAFPAIAACYKLDPENAVALFRRSVLMVVIWLAAPCLVACGFAHEILTLWIGSSYANGSAPVFRLLCLGVMLGGADQVVATFLDSIGQASLNAKFSIAELLIYIPVMVVMLHFFGIEGGALTWSCRAAVDFGLRFWLACGLFPPLKEAAEDVTKTLAFATIMLGIPELGTGLFMKMVFSTAALVAIFVFVWFFSLSHIERTFASRKVSIMRKTFSG